MNWPLIKGLESINDEPRASAARKILEDVRQALAEDQLASDLVRVLKGAVTRATSLVLEGHKPRYEPPHEIPHEIKDPVKLPRSGHRTIRVSQLASVVEDIKTAAAGDSAEVSINWEILDS